MNQDSRYERPGRKDNAAAYGVNPFFASYERSCEIVRVKEAPSEPLIGQADEWQPDIESGIW